MLISLNVTRLWRWEKRRIVQGPSPRGRQAEFSKEFDESKRHQNSENDQDQLDPGQLLKEVDSAGKRPPPRSVQPAMATNAMAPNPLVAISAIMANDIKVGSAEFAGVLTDHVEVLAFGAENTPTRSHYVLLLSRLIHHHHL